MHTISDHVTRKFVDIIDLTGYQIETDTGWEDISSIQKTIDYQAWVVKTQNNKTLRCADDHIVFDENFNEVFVKDLKENISLIITEDGPSLVVSIENTNISEAMFDITVDSKNHRYYTDGILSHNTCLIQAISYGLFGQALNNIKKDNLINRTNQKGMLVSVDFRVKDIDYRIVRGRKPNILKFYVNNQEQQSSDDSQGDSRETQEAIERVLCMSPEMFKQIIALNTYNEPFLGMKVSDQRTIIEQLLGITMLSEKADKIKELNKTTKDEIQKEEIKIKGVEESNRRIQEQIDNLKKRQKLWRSKHAEDLNKLVLEYDGLSKIDIVAELQAHKDLAEYNIKSEKLIRYNSLLARRTVWKDKLDREISNLRKKIDTLNKLDINGELLAHQRLKEYEAIVKSVEDYTTKVNKLKSDIDIDSKAIEKINGEISSLKEHKCYTCGQDYHDEGQIGLLVKKAELLDKTTQSLENKKIDLSNLGSGPVLPAVKPTTYYKTEADAIRHSNEIEKLVENLTSKEAEVDPYSEQLTENYVVITGKPPKTVYDTEAEAIKHDSRISTLLDQIEKKHGEEDPYVDQIMEMESIAIQTISYDEMNRLSRVLQHQDYLLDLLTNKKSFVRKRIIDQNLSYLNSRLSHYLGIIGLPHQVVFQNDLSVEITELGRELDFYNLSRGEMNRVVIALSFAFRDVFENLYSPINILFVDELIDSGMDTLGVENSLAILKDMVRRRNKSIWLISHKDELISRVDSVLKVVKSNGFTEYQVGES
jgi:DNA repair exonuclease SbcCD ATPase subunit